MEVDKATDENIQRNENILKSEVIAHDVLPVAMFYGFMLFKKTIMFDISVFSCFCKLTDITHCCQGQ